MSAWLWIPLIAFAVGIGLYANRASYTFLRGRTPDRQRWQRLHPDDLSRVLGVLEAIRECFGLRRDDIYRMQPADRLYDIYSGAYRLQGIDALEFESLAQKLIDEFGVSEQQTERLGSATIADVLDWTRGHAHT